LVGKKVGFVVEGEKLGDAVGFSVGTMEVGFTLGTAESVKLGRVVGDAVGAGRSPKRIHTASDGVSPFNKNNM